jgi:DNA-directed RNA polymerase specialized sigma subunit
MYLFVSDHADRYDAGREGRNGTLNFLAFLIGKLRTWPQDAARAAYGRNVMSDRLALRRAADTISAAEQRQPTDWELAEALHTSVTDLRRREQAIATLASLRNHQGLEFGSSDGDVMDSVQVAADVDVEADATDHDRSAQLTRAIVRAINAPAPAARRAKEPLALAAVYLTFWEGLGRSEVARELDVLPKTVAASVGRVLEQVQTADLL